MALSCGGEDSPPGALRERHRNSVFSRRATREYSCGLRRAGIQLDEGNCCCIALTNPTEVVISSADRKRHAEEWKGIRGPRLGNIRLMRLSLAGLGRGRTVANPPALHSEPVVAR
jgi:hypothetical protein